MVLGADTTLNGTTFSLRTVTGVGKDLTLGNSGVVTLNGAVSGVGTLTASGTGTLVVNNTISGASVADSEGTTFNVTVSPTVTTTGDQDYSGAVTLSKNTTLSSSGGGNITFNSTVDGAHTLAVNTSGDEIFNGLVGNGTALTSLTTDGSGTVGGHARFNMDAGTAGANHGGVNAGQVHIYDQAVFNVNNSTPANPSVSTTAGQIYGTVILEKNTVLKDIGGSISASSITANGNLLYYYLLNYIPPKLILVTGLFQDDILIRMLGSVLPTYYYQPIEVRRQKPVGPGHRTKLPPWMITLPKNSLEVPFDQD
jgi:hypothetical protein